MIRVFAIEDGFFLAVVSHGHYDALEEMAKVTGKDPLVVIGRALDICLNKKSMDLVVKGIKDELDGKDEGMGRG